MYLNVTAKARPIFRHYPQVADPEAAKAAALANPLYSWHATYFSVQHHRQVAFINDAADLLIILPNVYAHDYGRLQKMFEEQLSRQLFHLGISNRQIDRYLKQAGPWEINRTINRQIVGTLTQAIQDNRPLIGGQGRQTLASLAQQIKRAVGIDNSQVKKVIFADLPAWQKAQTVTDPIRPDRRLQNAANQLRYIEQRRRKTPEKDYDKSVTRIRGLNQVLIDAFVQANPDRLSTKTIHRHQQRLEFFLNEIVAYQLGTIYGPTAMELEEPLAHGASFSEMRQVRTALKKFYQYLHDQGLLSAEELQADKAALNNQLLDPAQADSSIWDNADLAEFLNPSRPGLPLFAADTEQLLRSYCTAFANLYGVISCDQAYRIIKKQIPQLPVEPPELIDWFEAHRDDQDTAFIIAEVGLNPSIIHPAIYQQGAQQDLLAAQLGLPFYLPDKAELLMYAFPYYQEDTPAVQNYQRVLEKNVHVPQRATVKWTSRVRRLFNDQFMQSPAANRQVLEREMTDQGYVCADSADRQKWLAALADLQPGLRLFIHRGLTTAELAQNIQAIDEVKRAQGLTAAVIAEIKAARLDPLDIIIGTTFLDELTVQQKEAIVQQLSALDIPTLG